MHVDPGGDVIEDPITFEGEVCYELNALLEKSAENKPIKSYQLLFFMTVIFFCFCVVLMKEGCSLPFPGLNLLCFNAHFRWGFLTSQSA